MNIKKYIAVFLSTFLLFSQVGVAFNVHFCDNEIASITSSYISLHEIEASCCGVVERDSKCCDTKNVKSVEKQEHTIVQSLDFQCVAILVPEICITYLSRPDYFPVKNNTPQYYCQVHAPPFYKLYHQYIFYA